MRETLSLWETWDVQTGGRADDVEVLFGSEEDEGTSSLEEQLMLVRKSQREQMEVVWTCSEE